MLRRFTILFCALLLSVSTLACSSPQAVNNNPSANREFKTTTQTRLSEGEYPVQQATYDDSNGEYSLMLLNANPPMYQSTDLQMARLTDEEVAANKEAYLKIQNGQASLHIPKDFRIEYVHNVTETRTDPQTGQPQVVVVRQQSSFWTPFAGALAGQVVGNLLFTPRYYVPPVYSPGVSVLTGYGGYGSSYSQAVSQYQTRYNQPPAAVRNRQVLRTTGGINRTTSRPRNRPQVNTSRPTGSGYGSSTLRRSNGQSPSRARQRSGSGFGSGGRSRSPARSGRRR